MSFLEPITATLLAVSAPGAEPVPFAVFFTDAGPDMCKAVAHQMNAQSTETRDPRSYCDE